MADSHLGDDEASLPKSKMQKMISDLLPDDITIARETREAATECCLEFIHLISSEANDICEKDSKKTIAGEHVIKALDYLGFPEFVEPVQGIIDGYKETMKIKEKRASKFFQSGMTQEELLNAQKELLSNARRRFVAQIPYQQEEQPTEGV